MEADKVKELLGEQGAKQVKEDLCVRKAADFIVDNAKEAKAAAKKTTKKEKAAEEKPEEAEPCFYDTTPKEKADCQGPVSLSD